MSQRWKGGSSQSQRRPTRPTKPCANPIFESWIIEWKEEAEAKDSKMKYVYAKALQSIRKYPLVLTSGKECSILENFGSHMCKMIDNRMAKENMVPASSGGGGGGGAEGGLSGILDLAEAGGAAGPSTASASNQQKKTTKKARGGPAKLKLKPSGICTTIDEPDDDEIMNDVENLSEDLLCPPPPAAAAAQKVRKKKQYLPAYRSGGYAILVALIKKENEPDYRGYMTKSELQQEAQRYCDASLSKPDSTKNAHYTAWNAMKILIDKELVLKRGNPPQFFLTPEGRALGQKLINAESAGRPEQQQRNSEDLMSDQSTSQEDDNDVAFMSSGVQLEPGKFEIVLYVDTCETNGRSKPQDVLNELQKNGVTVYVQRLSIGDFVWVCRELTDSSGNRNRLTMSRNNELILPYVVERKRADDLAHSIRDGRFHEQKFRLMQTKLQPIYLIESYGKGDWGLAEGALGQAICNTQIVNEFLVQETTSIKETCAYLTFMTRHLKTLYEHKTVIGCTKNDWKEHALADTADKAHLLTFSDFNDFSVKKTNWSVKEMFARHLMRLKGLSVDKAYAILQQYPTLHHLLRAYSECETEKQKELLLQPILFGNAGRKIGPAISRKIYRLYSGSTLS